MIEVVDGDEPIGLCALDKCTGEAARSMVLFDHWQLDLHYRVKAFFAKPICHAICRGCFDRKAN